MNLYLLLTKKNSVNGVSVTANMINWRKNFDLVGLFNERLFSEGDTEWGKRATCKGVSINYSENVIVRHPARHIIDSFLRKRRRVLGFTIQNNEGHYLNKILQLIIKGFLPPIRKMLVPFNKSEFKYSDKLILSILVYFLKGYSTVYTFGLILGLKKPQRE